MREKDQIVEGEVLRLAFGGKGILKHEGFVYFVPQVIPSERVQARVLRVHKRYADTALEQVVASSNERVEPTCPHYGICGGCQLQHMTAARQAEEKRRFVEDALIHLGKLTLPAPVGFTPAAQMWAYRRHVRLTLHAVQESYQIGYIGTDNEQLVPITQCPIFCPPTDPVLGALRKLIGTFEYHPQVHAAVTLVKAQAGGYIASFDFKQHIPSNAAESLKRIVEVGEPFVGTTWKCGREKGHYGQAECQFRLDDLTIHYSPTAFVQNHPEQSRALYHHIAALALRCRAIHVLDLYCGIGVTSLLLAKQGSQVVGVEWNSSAVALAKRNAKLNACSKATFRQGDVAKLLPTLLQQPVDLALLNPPRTGVETKILQALAAQEVPHLIYVSCMPSTLARDLQLLTQKGYKIASVEAYDMFPQTTHVETVVWLTRA